MHSTFGGFAWIFRNLKGVHVTGPLKESIAERRQRDRGNLDVMEFMWQISSGNLTLEDRKRKFYSQSVRSNKIGPIVLPSLDALWHLTYGQKKALYGTSGRIAVGGPSDKDAVKGAGSGDEEDEKAQPRTNSMREPVAFMDMSVDFYEDMYDAYKAKVFAINHTKPHLR